MRRRTEIDGATVLRVLVERSGLFWDELCDELGLNSTGRGHMELIWCLLDLAKLGLVTMDGVPEGETVDHIESIHVIREKVRASNRWHDVEMVLTKRYVGARRGDERPPQILSPMFGVPMDLQRQMDVFVIMPFNETIRPVYTDHLAPVAESLRLSCGRADDVFSASGLMMDIWSGICGAGAIVCDCTGRNPNVFYELGIAHTVGKPVVLITQNTDDVPADIRHIRFMKYDYTPPGMRVFEDALKATLTHLFGRY